MSRARRSHLESHARLSLRPRTPPGAAFAGVALLCALSALGCLPDEQTPPGRQLVKGQHIENLSATVVDGKQYLRLERRTALPLKGKGGTLDLYVIPIDGSSSARSVLRERSDSPSFPMVAMGGNTYWAVVNERAVQVGNTTSYSGRLTRFNLNGQVLESIENVSGYGVRLPEPFTDWIWFQRPIVLPTTPEQLQTQFVLRDDKGQHRIFDGIIGSPQFYGNGEIYFMAGPNRVLYRQRGIDGVPEPIRSNVSRFQRFGDWVALVVPEGKQPTNTLLDLRTLSEVRVPGERICCWLGYSNGAFIYSEGAGGGIPARLSEFNPVNGSLNVLQMPPGMVDVVGRIPRPGANTELLLDSRGNVAVHDPEAPEAQRLRVLPIRPITPRFIREGRQFLYVDPIPGDPQREGHVMLVDGDFATTPVELTPSGTKAGDVYKFFEARDDRGTEATEDDRDLLVFWARFGQSASDLYFADLDSHLVERKAEGIRDVSVTPNTLFGIIRTSLQDLVGDLVDRNLRTGVERLIAPRVDNFVEMELNGVSQIVYYFRNRAPTDEDGVWIVPRNVAVVGEAMP
ncbi:MAG: hypothetical protein SGI86_04480 [Deltaproteobacteria bacterium]|nr:hypothetical protein [Deltaproteobacteria bacterium]